MQNSVTQEDFDGCGAACVSFVTGVPYGKVVSLMGKRKAQNGGFLCKELVRALKKLGSTYQTRYLTPKISKKIYEDGVIVFIKRSKSYLNGHFLVRSNNLWMDPWLNYSLDDDTLHAISGFRKRLPGKPIYALFPKKSK